MQDLVLVLPFTMPASHRPLCEFVLQELKGLSCDSQFPKELRLRSRDVIPRNPDEEDVVVGAQLNQINENIRLLLKAKDIFPSKRHRRRFIRRAKREVRKGMHYFKHNIKTLQDGRVELKKSEEECRNEMMPHSKPGLTDWEQMLRHNMPGAGHDHLAFAPDSHSIIQLIPNSGINLMNQWTREANEMIKTHPTILPHIGHRVYPVYKRQIEQFPRRAGNYMAASGPKSRGRCGRSVIYVVPIRGNSDEPSIADARTRSGPIRVELLNEILGGSDGAQSVGTNARNRGAFIHRRRNLPQGQSPMCDEDTVIGKSSVSKIEHILQRSN